MQHSQAKTEFQEAIRLDGGFLPARLSLAELHINLNELAPAREVAEAAVRTFPNHPTVRTLLASVHLRQRNIAGAREHLAAAQNFAPNDPAVHVMLGVSYAGERKFAEAEREFEAALKLNPRYTPALAELAGVWTVNGQTPKAVARLKQHTAANRDDADSHLLLGSICRQSRDYPCAEAALTRAAELAPQNIQTRIQLGGVHQDQGRTDAAIQQYEQALKIEPRSAGIHALLGTLKLKKGDMDGARKHYEQGMSIDPNSAVIANNLAVTNALRRGNLDEAMALAQKAREISPDLVNAADTLGWIQYQKGLYSSAIRHLEEAVRKAPESGTYQYHLGMALVAAGQREKGRTHLEAATRLKIDPDDAAQARTALAKLR
jgi:tetratricopeptide (TPR) repeat protein